MNWKYLSLAALLGLSLAACDAKKEEKKADAAPTETAMPAEPTKMEEHKADAAMPVKEEHKMEEHKMEEHKAEEHTEGKAP